MSCSSSPSTADGVVLNNVPSVTTEGSILIFTCMGTSDMVTSTCGSDGMWSPEPADYVCVVPTMATTMSTSEKYSCIHVQYITYNNAIDYTCFLKTAINSHYD